MEENYDSWITLWKIVLVVGLGLFSTLAVWVSIGGFFDVKKLLRGLRDRSDQES